MKTRTGCTTVDMSVDGDNIGVFGVHSVFATSEACTANHEEVSVFLANTRTVAAHIRTVEGQDRVGVVADDTNG